MPTQDATRYAGRIRRIILSTKFHRDMAWNYLGLAVLGVSGILLNLSIARYYGPATLGSFNLVCATYLILSQAAVMGTHLSVQRHVAQHAGHEARVGAIISSGLVLTLLVASIVCGAAWMLRGAYGRILHSPDAARGLACALPGVGFFALNKVLLSVLNGFRRMKAFALFQALRYLLLLVFLMAALAAKAPGWALPGIFSGAEFVLFGLLLCATHPLYARCPPRLWDGWFSRHASFGSRALAGGILIDANTKIDVLMLGYFCNERTVGLYSLAAMLFEGFIQLTVVVRDNVNPVLAWLAGSGKMDELRSAIRRVMRVFYLIMALMALAAVAAYPIFVRVVVRRAEFSASVPVFAILMSGLILSAGYRPLDMLLVQLGRPGLHAWYISLTALSNLLLNALMIPLWGMYGAAVATAASYCFAIFVLKWLVRRSTGIRV